MLQKVDFDMPVSLHMGMCVYVFACMCDGRLLFIKTTATLRVFDTSTRPTIIEGKRC